MQTAILFFFVFYFSSSKSTFFFLRSAFKVGNVCWFWWKGIILLLSMPKRSSSRGGSDQPDGGGLIILFVVLTERFSEEKKKKLITLWTLSLSKLLFSCLPFCLLKKPFQTFHIALVLHPLQNIGSWRHFFFSDRSQLQSQSMRKEVVWELTSKPTWKDLCDT